MKAAHEFDQRYRPGQTAPVSGLYRVHHKNHRDPHDVVMICRDEFPGCRECSGEVRYTLLQQAAYVTHDFDLTAPLELTQRRALKLA